jgi:hypothetical protein
MRELPGRKRLVFHSGQRPVGRYVRDHGGSTDAHIGLYDLYDLFQGAHLAQSQAADVPPSRPPACESLTSSSAKAPKFSTIRLSPS